jgi:L-fuculose-phosphate aldolase
LGDKRAEQFSRGYNAVTMENHGIVVGGTDIKDAFIRFEALEFSARTIIGASTVGKVSYLSDDQIAQFEHSIPEDIPEMTEVEYPSEELSIRANISELVRRACDQGLMISSYGTVSVRWYDQNFLITPRNVPRLEMTNRDIVQIRNGKREPGKLPSRALKLHEQIYRENPDVNSIILTQSPNVMAFGVSDAHLDVRTIPESWIFLQDIPVIPFGEQFAEKDTIPKMISKNTPSMIIKNDSILVTGDKLLHTFDRLEVAEFSAKSLIMAKSIGDLVPINEAQIEDLRRKFL